jgi:hypothetical protein
MTYECPAGEFAADTELMKLQTLQNKVLRNIGKFTRNISVRDMHKLFTFRTYTIIYPNNAGNRHKAYSIMKIHIIEVLDKAKSNIENIRAFNLTTLKVNKMPL